MERIKCITLDNEAQDNLPQHIKDKMKADRDKARKEMGNKGNHRISCDCDICKNACSFKPGWFKFGEAEQVAKYLNITLEKLFNDYLSVDWYSEQGNDYYVLSPSVTKISPGGMFSYNPKGECVFYQDNKCKIHPVAPYECKAYYHENGFAETNKRHKEIAKEWRGKESYLELLLGCKPYTPEPKNFADLFGFGW